MAIPFDGGGGANTFNNGRLVPRAPSAVAAGFFAPPGTPCPVVVGVLTTAVTDVNEDVNAEAGSATMSDRTGVGIDTSNKLSPSIPNVDDDGAGEIKPIGCG